jgi:uncharacterized protein (TIGR00730 family)
MASILVFCGSAKGQNPEFEKAGYALGKYIGENGHSLVTGGGAVGLMGVVSDAAMEHGAHVTGIIPEFLQDREVGHSELQELVVVEDMHKRKALMYQKCDLAIVLPGGVGTLDECFEFLCWQRLKLHNKPLGVWNVAGLYDGLAKLMDSMLTSGFVGKKGDMDFCIENDLNTLAKSLKI